MKISFLEDIFDIETTIQLSKKEIMNNLTKIIGKNMPGPHNLPSSKLSSTRIYVLFVIL